MVSKSSDRSAAVDICLLAILAILINILIFGLAILNSRESHDSKSSVEDIKVFTTGYEIKSVDLQPTVDEWAASTGGTRSVLIYDLDAEQIAASYNPNQQYSTASLYKLFVVYEGYRRLENGSWNANDIVANGKTRLKCLDLAIRESNSPCAETLWYQIGRAELDEIIKKDFDIQNSDITHLSSNANDILKMLQIYYAHSEISAENWQLIADSMLNQPITTYNWRQGLPSGFSNAVDVYNKVGWEWNGRDWNIYHDAAILNFKNYNRHFIVVVLTNHVSHKKIAELGTKIEAAVNAALAE